MHITWSPATGLLTNHQRLGQGLVEYCIMLKDHTRIVRMPDMQTGKKQLSFLKASLNRAPRLLRQGVKTYLNYFALITLRNRMWRLNKTIIGSHYETIEQIHHSNGSLPV
jgi:hypothetical protein